MWRSLTALTEAINDGVAFQNLHRNNERVLHQITGQKIEKEKVRTSQSLVPTILDFSKVQISLGHPN